MLQLWPQKDERQKKKKYEEEMGEGMANEEG